jgi:predicted nuclease of restriction endonuclease-like (RecB) superfamily
MNELNQNPDFSELSRLITERKTRVLRLVNTELIDLYWEIGKVISRKVEDAVWGKSTVQSLADHLKAEHPGLIGFSASNIWRMRQFYEIYRAQPNLAPLLREISWSSHLLIMGRSQSAEEREFYLRLTIQERWSRRALQRQIETALFERKILSPVKLAPAVREIHPEAGNTFKDSYVMEFLGLPAAHSETDLRRALVHRIGQFLRELGRDFSFPTKNSFKPSSTNSSNSKPPKADLLSC